tara:strand:+ start:804 stop:986 length:183 start_codon:yes stop_codon:yes gene_type:complete
MALYTADFEANGLDVAMNKCDGYGTTTNAAHAADAVALYGNIDDAKYWVAEYHKLIKDNA